MNAPAALVPPIQEKRDPRVGQRATADEVSAMEDSNNLELVHGIIEEKIVGAKSSKIAYRVARRVDQACEAAGLDVDIYVADAEYQCFSEDPGGFRKPDVSVILRDRLPGGETPVGRLKLPPDLAVEVVSPRDIAYKVVEKVALYLRNGFKLVWVVYPEERHVIAYTADSIRGYVAGDTIDASPALPGVFIPVTELF